MSASEEGCTYMYLVVDELNLWRTYMLSIHPWPAVYLVVAILFLMRPSVYNWQLTEASGPKLELQSWNIISLGKSAESSPLVIAN